MDAWLELNRRKVAAEARRRFSVERMVDQYEAAFERVLGETRIGVPSRTSEAHGLRSIDGSVDRVETSYGESSGALGVGQSASVSG